jgi:hypothetical protein
MSVHYTRTVNMLASIHHTHNSTSTWWSTWLLIHEAKLLHLAHDKIIQACADPSVVYNKKGKSGKITYQREVLEGSYYSDDIRGINMKQKYKHIIQLRVMLISTQTTRHLYYKVSAIDWNPFIFKLNYVTFQSYLHIFKYIFTYQINAPTNKQKGAVVTDTVYYIHLPN